jgi:hypothetical protein
MHAPLRLLLGLVFVATPIVATGQPCNGSVGDTNVGGTTSSCPGPYKQTWDMQVNGNVACNDPGIGIQKTQNSSVTLTATGTCNGSSIQCGFGTPAGTLTSVSSQGSTWTWGWYNGVFSASACQNSDQTSYKTLTDLSTCTGGFCCGGEAQTHCTSQG